MRRTLITINVFVLSLDFPVESTATSFDIFKGKPLPQILDIEKWEQFIPRHGKLLSLTWPSLELFHEELLLLLQGFPSILSSISEFLVNWTNTRQKNNAVETIHIPNITALCFLYLSAKPPNKGAPTNRATGCKPNNIPVCSADMPTWRKNTGRKGFAQAWALKRKK